MTSGKMVNDTYILNNFGKKRNFERPSIKKRANADGEMGYGIWEGGERG